MNDIVLYQADPIAQVARWGTMSPSERRVKCVTALRDRDIATLSDLVVGYVKLKGSKGGKLSPQTERSYRQGIKVLVQVSERHGLSLVQPGEEFAALFMRALEAQGLKSATVRLRSVAARHLYAAAAWCGLQIPNPWDQTRLPCRDDAEVRHPYTDTEVGKWLALPLPEVRAAVLLGAHLGLRAAEICDLRPEDLDFPREQLVVRAGKGGKSRVVPMTEAVAAALKALTLTPGQPVLYTNYQQLHTALRRSAQLAGIEWRGIHSLRHTAGTELYRATGDLYVTARLLGHSNIQTTQIYAHMSQDHLRAALARRVG